MPPRHARHAALLILATACGDSGPASTTTSATTDAPGTTSSTTASPASTTTDTTAPTPTGTGPDTTTLEPTTATSTGELAPTTGEPTSSTTTTDTTSPDTTTDTSTGEPVPVCGNGVVEPGEACDLGRENSDTGACSTQCQLPVCGDGIVQGAETCDDGSGVGCDTYHDGGDGTCVAAGTCSAGFILAMGDCVAELLVDHVHIEVDNFCKMKVTPAEFTVQPGQKLRLSYHNHSVDYPVDVWMHYNGGFTDLPPGQTWNEKYEHCFGPNPSEGWAEISTACSQYELAIHCK